MLCSVRFSKLSGKNWGSNSSNSTTFVSQSTKLSLFTKQTSSTALPSRDTKKLVELFSDIEPAMPKRKTENPTEDYSKKTKGENGNGEPYSPGSPGKTEIEYDDLHGFKDDDLKDVADFRISKRIKDILITRGITKLFPIQTKTFDLVFEGKDLIARARTGTGKTIAFALPVVEKLLTTMTEKDFRRGRQARVLVMTPTRELAKQVCAEFEQLSGEKLKTLSVYGGAPYEPQERALYNGVDIVVGTPGRMMDHLEKGNLRLDEIQHVILDEADEMLDRGFADDIEKILKGIPKKTPKEHQVLMFSATIPEWVRDVARKHLEPKYVIVDLVGDSKVKSANTISHLAMMCAPTQKTTVLSDLVKVYGKSGKTIVFVDKKIEAADLSTNSLLRGISRALHGDIPQTQREIALKGFKEGKFSVLIATDVAARGLDIPSVDLVINFSPPKDVDSYIHRVGRTGRAGKKGTTITLFSNREVGMVQMIEGKVGIEFTRIGAPQIGTVIQGAAAKAIEQLEKIDDKAADYFLESAKRFIEEKGDVKALALALAQITGYTTAVLEKSMLAGLPGFTTVRYNTQTPIRSAGYIFSMLRPFTDSVHQVKLVTNGAVFDIPSEVAKTLVEQKKGYGGETFEICKEIPPELNSISDIQGAYGGGGYGGRGGYGGGYGRSSNNNNYGGGSRYGSSSRSGGSSYGGSSYGSGSSSSYSRPSYSRGRDDRH